MDGLGYKGAFVCPLQTTQRPIRKHSHTITLRSTNASSRLRFRKSLNASSEQVKPVNSFFGYSSRNIISNFSFPSEFISSFSSKSVLLSGHNSKDSFKRVDLGDR